MQNLRVGSPKALFPGYAVSALLLWATVASAASGPASDDAPPLPKIRFDIAALDDDGLIGPADGLRSLSYEFCIPAQADVADAVRAIDPSAQLFRGSPGRVSCSLDQYLVLGNTHQPGFRQVLLNLSRLDYVTEIRRSDFE